MKNEAKQFELLVSKLLGDKFNDIFFEQPILIGNPSKNHKFDLVNKSQSIVAECKNYSFTKFGNNPSAKISTLNETILFLSKLPNTTKKIIALRKSTNNNVTLAIRYYQNYKHLIDDIEIYEIDFEEEKISKVFKNNR